MKQLKTKPIVAFLLVCLLLVNSFLGNTVNAEDGISQNLSVSFHPINANDGVKTGNTATMLLSVTFSDPTEGAYAKVRIDIPNVEGLSLPQFANSNSTSLSDGSIMTLETEEDGSRYLLFTINKSGDTLNSEIVFTIPNGVTENNVQIPFNNDSIKVVEKGFSGEPELTASGFYFKSAFGWNDVYINKGNSTGINISSTGTLSSNVSWVLNALNTFNSSDTGVIYTSEYTTVSKITLPEGLSFKASTGQLSADKRYYLIDGVNAVYFDKAVESVVQNGQELTITYKAINDTLDASGNQAEGKKAADLTNLSLGITIYGAQIEADTAKITDSVYIDNEVTFTAKSGKDNQSSFSTSSSSTLVNVPSANMSIAMGSALGTYGSYSDAEQEVVYTITVTNTGSKDLAKAVVESTVGSSFELVTTGENAPTTGYSYNLTTGVITWDLTGIPYDQSDPNRIVTLKYAVKVKESLAESDQTNYYAASVTYDGDNTRSTTNRYNTYTAPKPVMSVSMTNNTKTDRDLGDPIEWKVVVSNTGNKKSEATKITFTAHETLKIDLIALMAKYPTAVVVGNTVTIPVTAINANDSKTFLIPTIVETATSNTSGLPSTVVLDTYNKSSSAIYYYKHLNEDFTFKKETASSTTYKDDENPQYVTWKLTATNAGNTTSEKRDIIDILPEGITMTDASFAALKDKLDKTTSVSYESITYEKDFEDGKDKLTIIGLELNQVTTLIMDVVTTMDDVYENYTEFENVATVTDGVTSTDYTASVKYLEPKPANVKIDKTVPYSNGLTGEAKENPRKIGLVEIDGDYYAEYEIDYLLTVKNEKGSTEFLQDKIQLLDNMHDGLKPPSANDDDPIGTTGTIEGTIYSTIASENGKKIIGTWEKVEDEKTKEVYYAVNWTPEEAGSEREHMYSGVPDLGEEAEWSVEYTGIAYAKMKPDGRYDEIKMANVGYLETASGGILITIIFEVGAMGELSPEGDVRIFITGVNDIALTEEEDNKESFIYPGDQITYDITAYNNTKEKFCDEKTKVCYELNGKALDFGMTNSLPTVRKESTFEWILGENVHITYPEDYLENGGKEATIEKVENPDGSTGYTIVWEDVHIECEKEQVFGIKLDYPTGEKFSSAFGTAPSLLENRVNLTNNRYYLDVLDQVDHIVGNNILELEKGVEYKGEYYNGTTEIPSVNASTEEVENRTVTWVFDKFGTVHYATDMTLVDELTRIRDKFDVTGVNFGKYTITRLEEVKEEDRYYKVVFIGEDSKGDLVTLDEFKIMDDEEFTLPENYDLSGVITINWIFGDVLTLDIETPPSVTAVAKESAYGLVKNALYLTYSKEADLEDEASVRILNSTSLSKAIYHENGELVGNEDDDVKAKVGEDVINKIVFTNVSGTTIDLSKTVFTDFITTGGLETGKDIVITIKHTSKSGTVKNPAVLKEQTISAADWADGEFKIEFSSGIMDIEDVLEISYKVTVSKDFEKSVDTSTAMAIRDSYALYNEVTVFTDTGDENTAVTDKYYAIMHAYAYMQRSIVGVGYTSTNSGTTGTAFQSVMFEAAGFGNSLAKLTGVPNFNLNSTVFGYMYPQGQDLVVFYNLTFVNSEDSTAAVTFKELQDQLGFTGTIVTTYNPTISSAASGSYYQFWSTLGTQKYINVRKNTEYYSLYNSLNLNDDGKNPSITEDGEVKNYTFLTSFPITMNSTGQTTGSVKLYPGQALSVVVAVKLDDNNFDAEKLSSTSTVKVEPEAGATWEPKEMKVDAPTIKNAGNKLTSNNGTFKVNGVEENTTLSSTVAINAPTYEVAVNKSVAGFYDANSWSNYLSTGQLHSSDSRSPLPSDLVVWQIDITNYNNYYMTGFELEDVLPYPYEVAAIYVTNSGDSGYSNYFKWNGTGTISSTNITITTPTIDDSNKPDQNTPYQVIKFDGNGNSFVNGSYRTNNTIAPGKTLTILIVARPSLNHQPEGAKLRTYDNYAYLKPKSEQVAVTGVAEGTPYYIDSILRGAYDSAVVKVGGSYSAVSSISVDNKETGEGHEVGVGNTAKNYVVVHEGGTFTYGITFKSTADYEFQNISMIDRLPNIGDRGVINVDAERGSDFRVLLAENPNFVVTKESKEGVKTTLVARDWDNPDQPWDYYVQFNTKDADAKFSSATGEDWVDRGTGGWTNTPTEDTTVFRVIYHSDFVVESGATLTVNFDGIVENPEEVKADDYAWNSFGYAYYVDISGNNVLTLQQAEPSQVGVKVISAKIQLQKVDEDGFGLEDAYFGIYSDESCSNESLVQIIKTDATGIATSSSLKLAEYWVQETKAPLGYVAKDDIYPIDLTNAQKDDIVPLLENPDGSLKGISNYMNTVTLQIKKVMDSNNNGEDLAGTVTISVTGMFMQEDGTLLEETKTAVFSKQDRIDGKIVSITKMMAGYDYIIKETSDETEEHIYEVSYNVVGSEDAIDTSLPENWPTKNGFPLESKEVVVGQDPEDNSDIIETVEVFTPTRENHYMTVTNTEPAPDLQITKRIYGDYLLDEVFTISVTGTFYDQETKSLVNTTKEILFGPIGDNLDSADDFIVKTDGDISWAEKTIAVDGIVYGYDYIIQEIDGAENYTTKYYSAKVPVGTAEEDKVFVEVMDEVEVTTKKTPYEVVVENTRKEVGEFTISNTVTGKQTDEVFVVNVTGIFSGNKEAETRSYELKHGETIVVDTLIHGLDYIVKQEHTEEQSAIYTIFYDGEDISYEETYARMTPGKSVTLLSDELVVAIENRYMAVGAYLFEALKNVDGIQPESISGIHQFVVNKIIDGEEVTVATGTNDETGKITFLSNSFSRTGALEYNHNLNGGHDFDLECPQEDSDIGIHTYIIREVVGDDEYIIYDDSYYTVNIEVVDNGDGTLETTALLTHINGEEIAEAMPFGENALQRNSGAVFLNYYTRDVVIYKHQLSNLQNALSGAQFSLYRDEVIEENLIATLITDKDGFVTFEKLTTGHYILVEEKSPSGYHLTQSNLEFDVALDVTNELVILLYENADLETYVMMNTELNRIEFANKKIVAPPSTGVNNSYSEYLSILFISLFGISSVWYRKKKEY